VPGRKGPYLFKDKEPHQPYLEENGSEGGRPHCARKKKKKSWMSVSRKNM